MQLELLPLILRTHHGRVREDNFLPKSKSYFIKYVLVSRNQWLKFWNWAVTDTGLLMVFQDSFRINRKHVFVVFFSFKLWVNLFCAVALPFIFCLWIYMHFAFFVFSDATDLTATLKKKDYSYYSSHWRDVSYYPTWALLEISYFSSCFHICEIWSN